MLVAMLVLAGSGSPAMPSSIGDAAAGTKAERKICRRYMQQGTMIRTKTVKVCRTATEWTRNEQDYQAMARSYQHAICGGQSNCQ